MEGGRSSFPAGSGCESAQSRPEEEEEEGARRAARTLLGSRRADHPALTGMMSLDVADSSCVHAAFLVYLDLLEARNWHEVSYIGLAEFQLVCLCGRERETDGLQVVVPTPVHVSISHESAFEVEYASGKFVCYSINLTHILSPSPFMTDVVYNAFSVIVDEELQLRHIMKKSYTLKDEPDSPLSITLAIVESDSTIVYYKLTHGFVTPDPPDDTEYVDDKQCRKKRKRFMRR